MDLVLIPKEATEVVWPLIEPMLEPAIAYTNGFTSAAKERKAVASGEKQLWVVGQRVEGSIPDLKAAGITSIQNNEDGTKTANIELFGGKDMKQFFDLKGEFEEWAKLEGCKDIRLWARKGWAPKLPDFTLTHYILKKELA